MKMLRAAIASLLIALVGPLSAQVLHFEGAFTEVMHCPRSACDGPQPMEALPFSFDVELKFNPSGPNHESFTTRDSTGWPRLAFSPAIEQVLFLVPATEPRVEDTYQFSRSQFTRHSTAEGFAWNFEASESWNEPIGENATRSEARILQVELLSSDGVTFEQASRPLTRDEMLGFLREMVGKQATTRAANVLEYVRDHDVAHGSFNLFGQFRLVSMCPAPTGLRKLLG
jgi:hypothetical protein